MYNFGMRSQDKQNPLRVQQYNTWVRLIRALAVQMAERAQVAPPEPCSWVYEDNKWKASWRLWSNQEILSINLLIDGRLVVVEGLHAGSLHANQVLGPLCLQEIQRIEEEFDRGVNWETLASLYDVIVSIHLEWFGLESTPELEKARLGNL